jgi:hypothetical protein
VALFSVCLQRVRMAPYDDPGKSHAVQLMTVLTRGLLSKNDLAGWQVMELFAGGVNQSDKFFNVSFDFSNFFSKKKRNESI